MKKDDINLIRTISKRTFSLLKFKRVIQKVTVVFFSFFIVFCFSILGYLLTLDRSFKANQDKISLLKTQIKTLEKKEGAVVTIADRIKAISPLLQKQNLYADVFTVIKSLLIPRFNLVAMETSSLGNIKISGECQDLVCLAEFNRVAEQLKPGKYRELLYSSVGRTVQGNYLLELELKND